MRRIRARSQHRPPFSGHARQLESAAADDAAYAGPMADALGIDDETAEQAEHARPAAAYEPLTVWCKNWPANGRTWTRDTLSGAKALADNILRQTGEVAYVYPTSAYNMRQLGDPIYVSKLPSQHEVLARDRKVTALVAFLRKTNISAADALGFSDYQWELAALGAKVNKPRAESRDQVVEELLRAEGASVVVG